jgi:hypothetical protein
LRLIILLLLTCFATAPAARSSATVPLQQMYEAAPDSAGYDRYLVLETGVVYTGGLLIGPTWEDDENVFNDKELALDVMIEGNGAILDLRGERICISFCANRLDIQDCIITGGEVRFRGTNTIDLDRTPEGSVRYCTFWRPQGYGVRIEGAGSGILLERNIIADAIDIGLGHMVWNGYEGINLPTGMNVAMSVQTGSYGLPTVLENWTYHKDPKVNEDLLYHFGFL